MTDEKLQNEEQTTQDVQIEDLAPSHSEQAEVKGGIAGGGIWISPGAH